jgi:DNA-directed RNA polymerase sigma subunit (sigma70/sigma32)
MKQFENTLIDNSFEDRIINKLDNTNNQTTLKKIIHLYKQKRYFKKRFHKTCFDNITYNDLCDRSISILEDRILLNLSWEKIGQKNYITRTRVIQIYYKTLRDLKLIVKRTGIRII